MSPCLMRLRQSNLLDGHGTPNPLTVTSNYNVRRLWSIAAVCFDYTHSSLAGWLSSGTHSIEKKIKEGLPILQEHCFLTLYYFGT
ncbi:hypothetical protein AVEN_173781-1 [Araneus ventricosus]|uniref:Uncharacterized protein n=1 Tax=Araneus ventricosus TaxID=182803 RepID=A0A4Y2RDJ4_ARAVE|nr:hypothetical protein AVEN_173781-1 [Araneus ventricosus]